MDDKTKILLKQANGRLKTAQIGVRIQPRGERLSLRATLPPKPNSKKLIPHQQKISLGIYANAAGISEAEKQAKALGVALASHQFDWADWGYAPQTITTVGEWRDRFFVEFPKRRKLKDASWRCGYRNPLLRLDGEQPLTVDYLEQFILQQTEPDTQARRRLSICYRIFAQFAGLTFDITEIIGDYSPQSVEPRDLPSDAELVAAWEALANHPEWQAAIAIQITYGLRNHGVYRFDREKFAQSIYLEVAEKGNEEPRIVPPLHPEWVEQFSLQSATMPALDLSHDNVALGTRHSQRLRRDFKLPFTPYTVRHCYARRCYEYGVSVDEAARWMGHSPQVHRKIYRRWIDADTHKRHYQIIIANPNRPKPP